MNKGFQFLIFLTIIIQTVSCGNGSNPQGSNNNIAGFIEARLDGNLQRWDVVSAGALGIINGSNQVLIVGIDLPGVISFTTSDNKPTSYQLVSSDVSDSLAATGFPLGNIAVGRHLDFEFISGTVIFQEIDQTQVKGTFHGELEIQSTKQKLTITDGRFSAPF